ncbi:MAG: 50S ribosomal protein L4 [Flavobacteriales bacterium]|jgi:large subunit ribosomal protein L4|tara:strand:+ start:1874 stop:2500 length:627 start_codon:yes stop_codon:yes gene_type:complete
MKLDVFTSKGSKSKKSAELQDSVFAIEPNDHAIYLDVKRYQAAQRQGTHDTLHRGVVSGSTRKIKKQKGTGTARAGSIKNPLFRGGGNTFGPEPRDYTIHLNAKLRKLARRSALSYKAKADGIMVVDNIKMDAPKTKDLLTVMTNLKLDDKKTLMILPSQDDNVYRSCRNLPKHRVMLASDLSTYDIMNCTNLLFVNNAHEVLEGLLK